MQNINKGIALLLLLLQLGCRKDADVCGKGEIKFREGHLVNIGYITSDKGLMDTLKAHPDLQILEVLSEQNNTKGFLARQVYKNVPLLNNPYTLYSTPAGYQLGFWSVLAVNIQVDVRPGIAIEKAKQIAEQEWLGAKCYTYELGIWELRPTETVLSPGFRLVYYFRTIDGSRTIAVDAHSSEVIFLYDGTAGGLIR